MKSLNDQVNDAGHEMLHDLVSIVVPVKDESASLKQLYAEVVEAFSSMESDGQARRWELIIVDDGSTDDSWVVIEELIALSSRVIGLRMRRNFGKSTALAAGLKEAAGNIVVTMDGDLQDNPAELPGMIRRLDETTDLVVGHKKHRADPLSKRVPSRFFNFVTGAVTGLRLSDHNCGLKVGKRVVFESVPMYGEMHRYLAAIAHAQGFNVAEQPVNHRQRAHGRSKYGFERYARGALDLVTVVTLTRYHRRPAHLFGGIGILIGMTGGLILLYLTSVSIFSDEAIGDRPLLLLGVLLVLLSVQLISLGVLAELIVSQQARWRDSTYYFVNRHTSSSLKHERGSAHDRDLMSESYEGSHCKDSGSRTDQRPFLTKHDDGE